MENAALHGRGTAPHRCGNEEGPVAIDFHIEPARRSKHRGMSFAAAFQRLAILESAKECQAIFAAACSIHEIAKNVFAE